MKKVSLGQPIKTFIVFSLPIICYLCWFHAQGHNLNKVSARPNALDVYAINLLDSLNPISIEIKREVGGRIIIDHGIITNAGVILGGYDYTMIPKFLQSPFTGKSLAHFHTHGNDDPIYDSENFSPADTSGSDEIQYLETPHHKILKHIPSENLVLQYDRVLNRWFPLGNARMIKRFLERNK